MRSSLASWRLVAASPSGALEDRAGVHHRLVEHQPEEVVAEVVVGGDRCGARARACCARSQRGRALRAARRNGRDAAAPAVESGHVERRRRVSSSEVVAVQQPARVGLAEAERCRAAARGRSAASGRAASAARRALAAARAEAQAPAPSTSSERAAAHAPTSRRSTIRRASRSSSAGGSQEPSEMRAPCSPSLEHDRLERRQPCAVEAAPARHGLGGAGPRSSLAPRHVSAMLMPARLRAARVREVARALQAQTAAPWA